MLEVNGLPQLLQLVRLHQLQVLLPHRVQLVLLPQQRHQQAQVPRLVRQLRCKIL